MVARRPPDTPIPKPILAAWLQATPPGEFRDRLQAIFDNHHGTFVLIGRAPRVGEYLNPRTRYSYGDRDTEARQAAGIERARWEGDVAANGRRRVDPGPMLDAVGYAHAAGITAKDIAIEAKVDPGHLRKLARGYHTVVSRDHRDRTLDALDRLIEQRLDAIKDLRAAIQRARKAQ